MKTQVILEIGSNFESLQDIKDSIDFAKSVGAIPKLQAFKAEELAEVGTPYYNQLKKSEVPREWMVELKGSGVFYSVFGLETLKFLEKEIKPSTYKIASGKAVDETLIKAIASIGKPTIMSVGGCNLDEIRQATRWFSEASPLKSWWADLTLMHCVVSYPPSTELLGNLRDRIHGSKLVGWGLSSHSSDIISPVMAVTLGATHIEKHFCLRPMNTPDSGKHSLNPEQFKQMVENIKIAEKHLQTHEQPLIEEWENLRLARRKSDSLR